MITSTTNPQIKSIKKLNSSSKLRHKERKFLIEGLRGVSEVPDAIIDKIFFVSGKVDISSYNCQCCEISENVMKAICATKNPQGIVALCNMPENVPFEPSSSDVVLVLDKINDPGNLGTIIRSSKAAGVDYLVLLNGSVDLYNDKVIRSSMGALFNQKIISGVDFNFVIGKIKTDVYATVLSDAETYYNVDLSKGFCLVMGNEANGLSEDILKKLSKRITIPMEKNTESLNLAVSTSVLLFEAKRQRDNLKVQVR